MTGNLYQHLSTRFYISFHHRIWREICFIALWHKTGRRRCSSSPQWAKGLTDSGNASWKEWKVDGRIASNMVILFRNAKRAARELQQTVYRRKQEFSSIIISKVHVCIARTSSVSKSSLVSCFPPAMSVKWVPRYAYLKIPTRPLMKLHPTSVYI